MPLPCILICITLLLQYLKLWKILLAESFLLLHLIYKSLTHKNTQKYTIMALIDANQFESYWLPVKIRWECRLSLVEGPLHWRLVRYFVFGKRWRSFRDLSSLQQTFDSDRRRNQPNMKPEKNRIVLMKFKFMTPYHRRKSISHWKKCGVKKNVGLEKNFGSKKIMG